ncbi:MAG: molybdopterin-dependent oxidoreductase [Nitriliruptorales bacterium]
MSLPSGKASDMVVYQEAPLNAGAPRGRLVDHLITPTEMVFVRAHAEIPLLAADDLRLRVEGLVQRPLELSLAVLADRFERVEVVAALCCAGNRRRELMAVSDIPSETPWGVDAVSNVLWSGWRLHDVLAAAQPSTSARHLAFAGSDVVGHPNAPSEHFGGSIPLGKALGGEVLLADRMNDEPLLPVHGFPLRLVVPGYIGARSVKWLARIEAIAEPSINYYQQRAYRLFPPEISADNVRWEQGTMLGELTLNAVICSPTEGAVLPSGRARFEGYALSGAGRRIERVEVTSDEGARWSPATGLTRSGPWGWTLWQAELDLSPGRHRIAVRAFDSAGNSQPEQVAPLWNFKGYANNAWHRIDIVCAPRGSAIPDAPAATA